MWNNGHQTPVHSPVITLKPSLRSTMGNHRCPHSRHQKRRRYSPTDHMASSACSQVMLRPHVRLLRTMSSSPGHELKGLKECSAQRQTTIGACKTTVDACPTTVIAHQIVDQDVTASVDLLNATRINQPRLLNDRTTIVQ